MGCLFVGFFCWLVGCWFCLIVGWFLLFFAWCLLVVIGWLLFLCVWIGGFAFYLWLFFTLSRCDNLGVRVLVVIVLYRCAFWYRCLGCLLFAGLSVSRLFVVASYFVGCLLIWCRLNLCCYYCLLAVNFGFSVYSFDGVGICLRCLVLGYLIVAVSLRCGCVWLHWWFVFLGFRFCSWAFRLIVNCLALSINLGFTVEFCVCSWFWFWVICLFWLLC